LSRSEGTLGMQYNTCCGTRYCHCSCNAIRKVTTHDTLEIARPARDNRVELIRSPKVLKQQLRWLMRVACQDHRPAKMDRLGYWPKHAARMGLVGQVQAVGG